MTGEGWRLTPEAQAHTENLSKAFFWKGTEWSSLRLKKQNLLLWCYFNTGCVTSPCSELQNLSGWEQERCHSMSLEARSLGNFPGRMENQRCAALYRGKV